MAKLHVATPITTGPYMKWLTARYPTVSIPLLSILASWGLAFPNNQWPNLYTIYGNAIDDAGNSERALRVYDSAIRLYPAAADIYLNKGTTLLKMKRYADAENIFKQGVMINPYLASAHYKLGICAMQQGKIIQSFFTYLYYLLLQPSGRYHGNCNHTP
ncbi:MAG: tetratricopeptide repeat protein [Chitinophagaceae bacterium]